MNVKIKNLSGKDSFLPKYETAGAAGFDLRAAIDRSIELAPGMCHTIGTGLAFEIPEGFELQVRPRSGLAFRHGVMTSLGTVDSDYRGEVRINLMNLGKVNITVSPGDRVAQGVIAPIVQAQFEVVNELTPTNRGNSGFGSTGVK